MGTILSNCLTIALEPITASGATPLEFQVLDLVFLAIYVFEFMLKIWDSPVTYWRSNYNKFDFVIVVVSVFEKIIASRLSGTSLRFLRSLRAFRALRTISFIRRLQVVFMALVDTIKNNAVHLLVLLFLGMFIFAVLGRYLFGVNGPQDVLDDWGSLPSSLYSLWVMVTAVGWYPYQMRLTAAGYEGSQVFTVLFMFFGHFIVGL
jgi:hypothetical protein